MARRRSSLQRSALWMAMLVLLPAAADAARIDYSLGGWVEHSDNIGLSENDPEEESTLGASVDFNVDQTGRDSTLVARGGVEYLYYTGNVYDDDVRATLVGQFNMNTFNDRLQFVLEDYASYEPVDYLTSNAPDNQQQVNVFVGGVTANLRPGGGSGVRADLRYNNYWAEETEDFNGDRYNAALTYWRDSGPNTRLSITFEGSQVEYDDAIGADYRRGDVYGTWQRKLANMDADLRLGYSRVELTDFDSEDTAPLFRLLLNWRPTARSTLGIGAYYQFADAALDLVSRADDIGGVPVIGEPSNDLRIGPDIYKQRRFDLNYTYAGALWTVDVRPYYEHNDYVDPTVETEGSYGLGVRVAYQWRPTVILSFLVSRGYRDFDAFDRSDDDFFLYLGIEKIITRHWSLGFDLRHQERDSNLAEASYDENAAIFSVRYTR